MADDDAPTLGSLGEFAVIDRLIAAGSQPASVLVGPGDDAALLAVPDGRALVSTDMLVEGRHFRLDWSSPHDVGRKAIAQNAADIEAMGGRCTGFVVAFGAPADTPMDLVAALSAGMWDEAARCGNTPIIGGDLVRSPQWVISVTVLGDLDGRGPVRLGGARAGDVVAVAGGLGRSAAGYALLTAESPQFPELIARHRVPEPPYGQGRAAAGEAVADGRDAATGLPVQSLYGARSRPDLSGLDALVIDLQDAGLRCFTYAATMAAYLREVQRHPLLTPEQTQELAVAFTKTQDPAIAARLVTANLRLVVKIAYELVSRVAQDRAFNPPSFVEGGERVGRRRQPRHRDRDPHAAARGLAEPRRSDLRVRRRAARLGDERDP